MREAILPGNQTGLLVGGLMMSLLAFVLITALSMSFIDRLRLSSLDQPNVFVLNVRNEDIQIINTIDTKAVLYDTILGRIQSINGVVLGEYLKQQKKTESNEFTREFNSTTRSLKNSPIIQGVAMVSGAMSLDESFAESL
jgi:predicted lysophospholipase L1 biosynthesis ABC-type transport system permease subunit